MNEPKCPTGRSISAHEKDLCECGRASKRSPLVQAMNLTCRRKTFRHRGDRRPKDVRRTQEWKDC